MLVKIALTLPLAPLTYEVPTELVSQAQIGQAVYVELRRKVQVGYIVEINVLREGSYTVKHIQGIAETFVSFSAEHLEFLLWLANYYHYPFGEVIKSALPPRPEEEVVRQYSVARPISDFSQEEQKKLQQRGGKKWSLLAWLSDKKVSTEIPSEWNAALKALLADGLILKSLRQRSQEIELPDFTLNRSVPPQLQEAQANALHAIRSSLEQKKFSCFLLEGVTGSGKTEIYIHAAQNALATGGGVLVLVPEIALTPQLFQRFQSRLQEPIAILHSGLSARERSRQWSLLNSGRVRVALGARSTILSPLKNIQLVIVDEEHESAFKQEDRLRYNARDVAILRAKLNKATIVLGSATPSLESYHHVQTGRYQLLRLEKRVTTNPLPEVEIVDQRKTKMTGMLSAPLLRELKDTLSANKQSMLLLNRRGYASYVLCEQCGFVPECRNCSVSLTFYAGKQQLSCHYCGYQEPMPKACSRCACTTINHGSPGTEALEMSVQELFPTARILRVDRENIRGTDALETALLSITNNEIDIIIGTQMIAKGHDFPNVRLVGVINADSSINFPDFRSAEKSFQLFTQMAGRAGRGDFSGKVIIQSFLPEHPSIRFAALHDFRAFAELELKSRLLFQYPPYFRLARLLVTDPSAQVAQATAEKIAQDLLGFAPAGSTVLGPAPSLLQKLQNRYRWNILLKSKESMALNALLKTSMQRWQGKIASTTSLSVDVDPSTLF